MCMSMTAVWGYVEYRMGSCTKLAILRVKLPLTCSLANIAKTLKNQKVFGDFGGASFQDAPTWHQIRIQNRSEFDLDGIEIKMQVGLGFGPFLERFLVDSLV